MGTSATAARTYTPVPWAVLPGTAVRGLVLSIVYMPLSMLVFWYVDETLGAAVGQTLGLGGAALVGFLVAFVGSVVLALVGFGRREYVLGEDGITERRGILFTRETHFPYEDIEEVTHTQSKMQSWYGSGTIHVTEVERDEEQEKTIRFEYIRSPGAVYTNILRNIADVTGATEDKLDDVDIEELQDRSGDVSRISGDNLAAGTGFRYLMPSAVLHPSPGHAAQNGIVVGLFHTAVVAVGVYWLQSFLVDLFNLSSAMELWAGFGVAVAAYALARAGWAYWQYDTVQYELYDDHIRFITDEERVSVAIDDVMALDPRQDYIKWNSGGHIGLLDGDGNELRVFKFVPNFEKVASELDAWATASAGGAEAPGGTGGTDALKDPTQTEHEQESRGPPGQQPRSGHNQQPTDQQRRGGHNQPASDQQPRGGANQQPPHGDTE